VVLKDAGHICTPTESLRQVDNEQRERLPLVGKIVGKHVQVIYSPLFLVTNIEGYSAKARKSIADYKTTQVAAGRSKDKPAPVVKPAPNEIKNKEQMNSKGKAKEEESAKEMPVRKERSTGKLDWSRAKPKDVKVKKEETREEIKVKEEPKTASSSKRDKKPQEEPKVSLVHVPFASLRSY
jgi:hypothetical protein